MCSTGGSSYDTGDIIYLRQRPTAPLAGGFTVVVVKISRYGTGIPGVTFAADIYHALLSMLLAERRPLAVLGAEANRRNAGTIGATTAVEDVYHAALSMLLAKCRHLAALDVEAGHRRAGIMQASTYADVHHIAPSMLLAERRLLAALEIGGRFLQARVHCTFEAEVYHGLPSMTTAEQGRLTAHAIEMCLPRAEFYQTTTDENGHHAVLSVLHAEYCRLAAMDFEERVPPAGIM